jgi:type IV pilus assembly protein PilE
MERWYTANLTYVGAVANTTTCQDSALDYYTIAANPAARTFTVTAVPRGAHSGDACGTLGVNQAGAKSAGGTNCW